MIFIETHIFTEQVTELLSDERYKNFQIYLADNPSAGKVIRGTGGLRKVRWSTEGGGKSGGVRVIYFYISAAAEVRLLLMYKKGIKDSLNAEEKKVLRRLNATW